MNIYKRQMKSLGVNLKDYSKILDVPEVITKKIINGNGEVTKNMEINNFLRKNLFNKHQEVEKNKDEKKEEALNLKIKEKYENEKIQRLIEKHPNSIEVEWYLNQFNYKEYFEKYNITSWHDLERRYNWKLDVGRIKGQASSTTLQRICTKDFQYIGKDSLYELILLLYDCFVNEKIKPPISKSRLRFGEDKRGLNSKRTNSLEELELIAWFKNFNLIEFMKNKSIDYKEFARQTNVAPTSVHQLIRKSYTPSYRVLVSIKKYIDSFEENIENYPSRDEIIINDKPEEEMITTVALNTNDIIITNNEELLRNLLKDRLTEEEKTLIRLFGGKI